MPLRISRRFTSGGSRAARTVQLQPLAEAPQLGARVYQSLLSGIISGTIEPVASLRPDAIAEQLNVSTRFVRHWLCSRATGWRSTGPTKAGLSVTSPSQMCGECMSFAPRWSVLQSGSHVSASRRRNSPICVLSRRGGWVAVLALGDMDAYRIYNRDLHASIVGSTRNSYLSTVMQQLSLQSQMLAARTIRVAGRPSRANSEHERLIECIERGDSNRAEQVMERHILVAPKDVLKHGKRSDTAPESDT